MYVIAAPLAVFRFQLVRVDGLHGWYRIWHADLIQPLRGVQALRVDGLTAITRYKCILFTALTGSIGSVELSRVDIVGLGKQVWGNAKVGGNRGFLLRFECGRGTDHA